MDPAKQVKLEWADVEALCHDITKQLRGEYEVVVPVARGGLCPGAIVANILGISNVRPIRWQTRDGEAKDHNILYDIIQIYNRILIVDDMIDSGKCFYEISKTIRTVKDPLRSATVTYAVLLKNISYEHHADEMYNLVYGRRYDKTKDDRFVVFPWENVGP